MPAAPDATGAETTAAEVVVRRRRADDIEPLGRLLLEQQPTSRYPFRDPLPIPVSQFLHADDADAAWVAELAGAPVGHVCRIDRLSPSPDVDRMVEAAAAAHGCGPGDLGWVSSLFVGLGGRGRGVGRLLHDAVVADLRAAARRPTLEVLSLHAAARRMYDAAGWREVARLRPAWLVAAAGGEDVDVAVLVLPEPLSAP